MSSENQKPWVLITLAVIGVVGTLGGALISNWDKFFPQNVTPTVSADSDGPSSEESASETSPIETADAVEVPESQSNELDSSVEPVEAEAEQQEVNLDEFAMTLQKCERSPGDNVECNFLIKPNQDVYFSLRCQYLYDAVTTILDSSGIDYKCALGQLGGDEEERDLNKLLSQDKPVAAKLTFEDVPSDVETLSGITVYYSFASDDEGKKWPYASELIEFDETAILPN